MARCGLLGKPVAGAVAGLALLGGGLAQVQHAHADFTWCWDDPVLQVGGKLLTVNLGVLGDPATVRATVQAANIVVHVPAGLSTQVVSTTSTYFRENVAFVADESPVSAGSGFEVRVQVTFSATAPLSAAMVLTSAKETQQRIGTTSDGFDRDIGMQ